jgi:transcriptional regulator with XRE-family HTH domain
MNPESLREELIKRRPGLKQHLEENEARKNVALALLTLRKEAGLTQTELARKTGMTQARISIIESPTGPMPGTDTIRRYAEACGFVAVIDFYEKKRPRQKVKESGSPRARASVFGGGNGWFEERFRVAAAPLE